MGQRHVAGPLAFAGRLPLGPAKQRQEIVPGHHAVRQFDRPHSGGQPLEFRAVTGRDGDGIEPVRTRYPAVSDGPVPAVPDRGARTPARSHLGRTVGGSSRGLVGRSRVTSSAVRRRTRGFRWLDPDVGALGRFVTLEGLTLRQQADGRRPVPVGFIQLSVDVDRSGRPLCSGNWRVASHAVRLLGRNSAVTKYCSGSSLKLRKPSNGK